MSLARAEDESSWKTIGVGLTSLDSGGSGNGDKWIDIGTSYDHKIRVLLLLQIILNSVTGGSDNGERIHEGTINDYVSIFLLRIILNTYVIAVVALSSSAVAEDSYSWSESSGDKSPSLLVPHSWVNAAGVLLFNESSDMDTWHNFTFGGIVIDEVDDSESIYDSRYGGGNVGGGGGGTGDGGGHGGGGNFGLALYHDSLRGLFTLFSKHDPDQNLKDQMQLQEAHMVIASTNRQIFAE